MTSRERILAALSGGKPDRLPTDVGATEHTGVLPEVYGPLKDGLGMSGGHTRISNPFCGTVRIERTFLDKLGVDAAGLFHEPRRWRAGELPDGTSCLLPEKWQPQEGPDGAEVVRHPIADFTLLRRPGEGWFSYQYDKAPLAGCRSREDLNRRLQTIALFDWPYHVDEIASEFGVRARERRKGTERAFVLNIRARIIGGAVVLRGDAFFRDLEENEALAEALLEKLTDAYIARLTDFLPETAPHADVLCLIEGPATHLTVEQYRRFIRPHHERLFRHIAKTAGLPLVLFSKGVGAELLREIVELGVDAVGFSTFPGTPTPAEVRKTCGREVALWGTGCRTAFLVSGDVSHVRREVTRCIEAAGGPERLVFAFGEPLPAGARHENVVAALDAARGIAP